MHPAMGTLVHVSAVACDSIAAREAVSAAFDIVTRIEGLMSFHDPDSDVSRLNREGWRRPQTVHRWTWTVVKRALRFAHASDGLFDITVAPLLVHEGLLPGSITAAPECGHWRHIKLLSDCRISLARPMLLDLGGIAKGFAVDQAIHQLRKRGCTEAVVNAGGDLRCYGSVPRPIQLRRRDALVTVAELHRGAVATSAPRTTHVGRLAQPLGSIFNPHTRRAWNAGGAVMVAAPSCVVADALTKVAALAGPACAPLLARFGAQARWDAELVSAG
jgi:thiamine biosynthesis lipoprotein